MFTESLYAAALTFAAWYGDVESDEARSDRLRTIAAAIDEATLQAVCEKDSPVLFEQSRAKTDEESEQPPCQKVWFSSKRELAFLLLTQAYFETRLAQHVHEGRCRVNLGECDGGKATSLWQLQAGGHLPKERWEQLSGTSFESTTRAAYEAARALGRGRNFCKTAVGAVALYATGRSCTWEPAQRRVSFMSRLAASH